MVGHLVLYALMHFTLKFKVHQVVMLYFTPQTLDKSFALLTHNLSVTIFVIQGAIRSHYLQQT